MPCPRAGSRCARDGEDSTCLDHVVKGVALKGRSVQEELAHAAARSFSLSLMCVAQPGSALLFMASVRNPGVGIIWPRFPLVSVSGVGMWDTKGGASGRSQQPRHGTRVIIGS